MTYPAAITSFTTKTDGADDVLAAHMNAVQTDITNIETELGTDPAGTATDLKTRLAVSLSGAGLLQFAAATTLTIATGSVTATQNYHRLDTEAAAASDDLDTITAGSEAQVLILRTVSGARNVVIKNGTGNINCTGGKDITLDNNYDLAILVYDASLSVWIAFGNNSVVETQGTWTPTFTGLTVVGTPSYTGRYTRDGKTIHFEVTITSTVTTAAVAGTTFINNLPVTAAYDNICLAGDLTTLIGVGTGIIPAATTNCYPPAWSASGDTFVVSGWYEIS